METGKSAVQFPQEAGHGLGVGVWSIDITCDLATNSCFASGLIHGFESNSDDQSWSQPYHMAAMANPSKGRPVR
jgi:hypothetical protein